jgi:hypothetical protein
MFFEIFEAGICLFHGPFKISGLVFQKVEGETATSFPGKERIMPLSRHRRQDKR